MKKNGVSLSVIRRLPRYYRFLGDLLQNGVGRISSKELSQKMNLTASQIRQDLNCFGGFGQQGYGYNIEQLHREIGRIIGVDTMHDTILIGAGNLGSAIAAHMNFEKRGFRLVGIFDSDPQKSGEIIAGLPVRSTGELETFCRENHPTIAILCIPKTAAPKVAPQLVDLGITGFWNFSHYDLRVDHSDVVVENVHLGDSLLTLCYQVTHNRPEEDEGEK
ncbi:MULTISPECIES: redox-sensing transcriptional repressor Rex [Eubacteriales]|uniref:Redox-sensing transcriptional repressor Rex n=1 Tax=Bittarella massiliensis (ex Durand et al. 2017) TaxID=1720313 RepID=A0AAQ1MBY5_9FIRM|nr:MULTISPECIES: redox-sensing transcriptional repressor Rex [Eubacteriales]ERI98131.1 putative redox-sensing transcriptional repressor Rex [Clostridium sp. ATCC 29733]MZL69579.1 redox-sensing transcriptional repressor Rex [Bittarella massiliensis (ex Durand et al. 2017)]MZL80496.1 redox-sensing transcriptional repressor Rex [Bittarella massiliensis (ex Durand et al. 2017)]SHF78861.1 redox-sensing transcriptional repressor [Bittarella massiliensis (ex Durand et al. 2017)]